MADPGLARLASIAPPSPVRVATAVTATALATLAVAAAAAAAAAVSTPADPKVAEGGTSGPDVGRQWVGVVREWVAWQRSMINAAQCAGVREVHRRGAQVVAAAGKLKC